MIELFFVTCLIADPQRCSEHSLLFEQRNGLFTCMLWGQNELARWVAAHPKDQVVEWKCRLPKTGDTQI
ncbi:hypothetical protein [Paracoccus sp. SSK6]|uniref:hypothetical protein n=1 Tax=Paracoccus sp. SSK6 TaxID=3143131 RepID=UPI00321B4DCC